MNVIFKAPQCTIFIILGQLAYANHTATLMFVLKIQQKESVYILYFVESQILTVGADF